MKKGDVFEGRVLRIDFPNKGIVEAEGERIVVIDIRIGQMIQGVLTKKRRGTCEGRLLSVVEPSSLEIKAGHVPTAACAAAACIRGFPMRNSLPSRERR